MGTLGEKTIFERGKLSVAERDQLIIQYAPWVKFIALRMAVKLPSHVQAEDLISAGIIGLIDALDKFNPDREVQFKTYAQIRIKGAIGAVALLFRRAHHERGRQGSELDGITHFSASHPNRHAAARQTESLYS